MLYKSAASVEFLLSDTCWEVSSFCNLSVYWGMANEMLCWGSQMLIGFMWTEALVFELKAVFCATGSCSFGSLPDCGWRVSFPVACNGICGWNARANG